MKHIAYAAIPAGFIQQTTCIGGQLHTIAEDTADTSEAVYAATWDGVNPYVEVEKGDMATLQLGFLGWPTEDKVTYEERVKTLPVDTGTPQQPIGENL